MQTSDNELSQLNESPGSDEAGLQSALFDDVGPIPRIPTELTKATAAIHIYPVNGSYTHFVRRAFNGLLVLTLYQWNTLTEDVRVEILEKRIAPKFICTIGELRKALDFKDADHGNNRLYEAIEALYRLEFKFDVMEDHGPAWAVSSRVISQWARAKDGSGRIAWEYPPDVLRMLVDSIPWAKIHLKLCNSMNSGYALALYENTNRYVTNPAKRTRRLPVDQWVHLIAGDKIWYQKEYRYFKRHVLGPAMSELEANELVPIQLTLLETKGPRGKVTHLQFLVELKKQLPLPIELGATMHPRMKAALKAIGLSDSLILKFGVSMEQADLGLLIDATRKRMEKGTLSNPAGYFIATSQLYLGQGLLSPGEDGDKGKVTGRGARANTELSDEYERRRGAVLRERFDASSEDEQAKWTSLFLKQPSATSDVVKSYEKGGVKALLFDRVFFAWLKSAEQGAFLNEIEWRSFDDYLSLVLKDSS